MLTALRSKSGGIVAKVFIALLAGSFAVWGIEDMLRGGNSETLAKVGDREIGSYEFSEAFNRQLSVYSRRLGETVTPDRARQLGIDRQILGDLMRDAALDSQAAALGITMPERAVAQRVADSPQFQGANGSFNADSFRNLLRQNGFTEEQFFATERAGMTRQVISQPLTTQAVVPNTLVELIWKHRTEQRDATYFEFTLPDDTKQPTDAGLKALYDENKDLFREPERRSMAIVALTPEAIMAGIEVSEDDLKRQYEATRKQLALAETRTVLQIPFDNEADAIAAAQKIKDGTSFEDIAREQGKTEADISLGTVAKSAIPDPAVAEAAFALADGAVSEPVKSRFSTVLLKAKIVGSSGAKSLDEMRDELSTAVRAAKARDQLLDLHDKFEDARASGASLEEAAAEIGIKVANVGPVALDGTDKDGKAVVVPGHSSSLATAFDTEIGLEISPLTDGDDGFTWLETRDIVETAVPAFNDIKDKVADTWQTREAASATRKKAEELVAKLRSGTPIADLAKTENTEVRTVNGVRRNQNNAAFNAADVAALFSVAEDGKTFSIANDGKSAKIIASTPVLGTGFNSDSEEAKAIRQVLETNLSNDLYAEYVNALQEQIGVTINDSVWARLASGAPAPAQPGNY
ncbi:MAG: SurA N-terminal domain-containing protein [Anderseniella sp.]